MRTEKALKFEGGIYDSIKQWPRRWSENRQWRKSQDNRRCRRTERQMVEQGLGEFDNERSEPSFQSDFYVETEYDTPEIGRYLTRNDEILWVMNEESYYDDSWIIMNALVRAFNR